MQIVAHSHLDQFPASLKQIYRRHGIELCVSAERTFLRHRGWTDNDLQHFECVQSACSRVPCDESVFVTTYITQLRLSTRRRHSSEQKRRTFNQLTQFRTSPLSGRRLLLIAATGTCATITRLPNMSNGSRRARERLLTHSNTKSLICIKSRSHFVTHVIIELIERKPSNYYCLHDFSTGTGESIEPSSRVLRRRRSTGPYCVCLCFDAAAK